MRNEAARWLRAALFTGLLLVGGLAGAHRAQAADEGAPWLGVYLQPLTEDLREGMDYRGDGGVIVSRVVPDGPADRAGLRNGDVIVRLDGRAVDSPAELQEMIRSMRVGKTVNIEVFRDGERHVLAGRIGERPSDEELAPRGQGEDERDLPEPPEAPEPPTPPRSPHVMVMPEMGDMSGLMGMASRGRLGVRIESLSPDLGGYFGVPEGRGVLVLEVLDDTPARRAGLRAGDVITRVDQEPVRNSSDLVEALRGKTGRVQLRILRHRESRTIEAVLERPGRTGTMFDDQGNVRRRIIVNGKEITPGTPGAPKRIVIRRQGAQDQAELRREMEQLRRQLDELQRQLDEERGNQTDRD